MSEPTSPDVERNDGSFVDPRESEVEITTDDSEAGAGAAADTSDDK